MEHILLDTNVISELMRPVPEPRVMRWFSARPEAAFYTSAVTKAEVLLRIALLPAGKRRDTLATAAEAMFSHEFAGRCLPFEEGCAASYASVVAGLRAGGRGVTVEDALIAAIAIAHGCSLATRNTKDFDAIGGLSLCNPWQE